MTLFTATATPRETAARYDISSTCNSYCHIDDTNAYVIAII
jgi:hypothetical protein